MESDMFMAEVPGAARTLDLLFKISTEMRIKHNIFKNHFFKLQ